MIAGKHQTVGCWNAECRTITGFLWLLHHNICICPFGRPSKPAIKGQESFRAPSGCQMHGIGKIHTVFRMARSLDQKVWIFNRYGGQSRESSQRADYISWLEIVGAAQNSIGFQYNSGADKDIVLFNHTAGDHRLLVIVVR